MSMESRNLSYELERQVKMVWKFWKRWRSLQDRRRSMGWMLMRKDDHLLKDIGLTRNDLRILLEETEE